MTAEDCAVQRATGYIRAGMVPEAAIDRACRECGAVPGLGQDATVTATPPSSSLYTEIETPVAEVSSVVSPWLWILSVGGFALAIWNKVQIQKMYGSWKKAKAAHR